MWEQLSIPTQRQLSANGHREQQTDSLTHHVTNKASRTWKPSTAKHVLRPPPTFCHMCTHVCTCTASAIGPPQQLWSAAGSWTLNHIQGSCRSCSRIMDPELHSSLKPQARQHIFQTMQTLSLSPMSVFESVAAFLQLHPSAAMGRCRGQQAGGPYLMSTLAWTAWPPCMLQWTP